MTQHLQPTWLKKACLFLIGCFMTFHSSIGQTLNFTVNPTIQCANQYTTTAQAGVISSPPGATSYSWTFNCTNCNASFYYGAFNPAASQIFIAYLNPGTTTVTCIAYNGNTVLGSVTKTIQVLTSPAPFTINSSSPPTFCAGPTVTLSATGVGSYSWLPSGTVSNSIVFTPTASGCYTAITTNANNCSFSVSYCMNVASGSPSLSLSPAGNFSLCGASSGNFGTLSVSGAFSYTWASNSSWNNGSNSPNINLNSLGCYTVTGSNGCGTSTAVACATGTLPPPSLSITGPATVCSGQQTTLTVNGLNGINTYPTYFWYSSTLNNTVISQSFQAVVTPTANTCYTLYGQNPACGNQASYCLTVTPGSIPSLSISGGSNFYCQGAVGSLSVSGNATNYQWSNNTTGTVIVLSPNSNTCLSVTGTNSGGCSATAFFCYSVIPTPSLSISGSNSVCLGSSVSFTASGASAYTWNPGGSAAPTLSMIPTGSGVYTLSGSIPNSTCLGSATLAVTVNTACAIVWPGDANRDGVVDNSDVFELGLAAASNGAARSGASISWAGQFANAWVGNVSTGWNKCHADCNGDGTVNSADTLAINTNYSNTHAFRSSASAINPDLILVPQQSEVFGGMWNVVDVVLGDAGNNLSQLYGAAFELDYDKTMVESDSVKLIYTPSFLNAANQNIQFRKTTFTNGKLYAASVRTDATNVNGNGKIGELWFKLNSSVPDNSSFNFGINNGKKTSAAGNMGVLSTSGAMNMNVSNNATGIKGKGLYSTQVKVYPNPAKDKLMLENNSDEKIDFYLYDITSRKMTSGSFSGKYTLNVSALEAGAYLLELNSEQHKQVKKVVLEK
ncbi:MAG: T9SS type A sorting domain-containing protein [Bacteroidia bacterium]|nr:T9SS type A sorting domain-containing protein [Bacteroidia bacterium]